MDPQKTQVNTQLEIQQSARDAREEERSERKRQQAMNASNQERLAEQKSDLASFAHSLFSSGCSVPPMILDLGHREA